jgi:RNA polymerase sigma factor (sigma-70 family)
MSAAEFDQVLAKQSDFLRPFALSLTRDLEAAGDLMQETLYRALANREKYSAGTHIRAWLCTILRNIFINDYRRKVKQKKLLEQAFPNQANSLFTADGALEHKEVWAIIWELPQIFRNPFILYVEGYKYAEIAEMLREPIGTIKSRIHFARQLLKGQIK